MDKLLARIRADGPIRSRDVETNNTKRTGWWDWKPAKKALEQMCMEGDLMVSDREGCQKTYDLTDRDEVWIAALFYRQATASPEEAEKLAQTLDLDPALAAELTRYPVKGTDILVPTDPLLYRFYEII